MVHEALRDRLGLVDALLVRERHHGDQVVVQLALAPAAIQFEHAERLAEPDQRVWLDEVPEV